MTGQRILTFLRGVALLIALLIGAAALVCVLLVPVHLMGPAPDFKAAAFFFVAALRNGAAFIAAGAVWAILAAIETALFKRGAA